MNTGSAQDLTLGHSLTTFLLSHVYDAKTPFGQATGRPKE
jgi:hypothetical protein